MIHDIPGELLMNVTLDHVLVWHEGVLETGSLCLAIRTMSSGRPELHLGISGPHSRDIALSLRPDQMEVLRAFFAATAAIRTS